MIHDMMFDFNIDKSVDLLKESHRKLKMLQNPCELFLSGAIQVMMEVSQ